MSKVAKRLSPVGASKRRTPRSTRKREVSTAIGSAPASGVVEGRVIGTSEPGQVRGVLAGGETIEALCPAHVDAVWLQAACARGPVAAAFVLVQPSGRHLLWGIFPGPEHADVRADIVIRGRHIKVDAEALQLSSRSAHLDLDGEGNVAVKGRDVTSHARRVNRIKGGSIRLN